MFVKEHCWFFYDYYLANTKQMRYKRIIKMARAFLADLKLLYANSVWITKNNVKANIWKLFVIYPRQIKNSWKISPYIYIFAVTARLPHAKMPNFTFCEERKQAMTKYSLSLWTWIWLIEIQLQKGALAFDKVSELE